MSYPQLEEDYDVAAENIQCNADKIGAKVYEIKTRFFKHQPIEGAERPRIPVFLGFRDEWDL